MGFLRCGAVGTALLLWSGLALAKPWEPRVPAVDPKPAHQLRNIATWKMEGYTNQEIAAKLDCAPSTVERKLQRIRTQWQEEVAR